MSWIRVMRAGLCLAMGVVATTAARGATRDRIEEKLRQYDLRGMIRTDAGVTRDLTPIPACVTDLDFQWEAPQVRILLVGGLDGSRNSVTRTLESLEWFRKAYTLHRLGDSFSVSAIPIGNPDGWAEDLGETNLSGGQPGRGYPAKGDAYNSPENPEAQYLWRWIGMHAPDLVVELRAGDTYQWSGPEALEPAAQQVLARLRGRTTAEPADDLAAGLQAAAPSETGTIPAFRVACGQRTGEEILGDLVKALQDTKYREVSAARREIRMRVARTPIRVAQQLCEVYGRDLKEVIYMQALGVVGQIRTGQLLGDPSYLETARKATEAYLNGSKPTLGPKSNGSHLAGHLVFGELARATRDSRYTEFVKAAAAYGFEANGDLKESMPFHSEMSDSVFMGCAILAQAGGLTGEGRYFEMCERHLQFMQDLCLRDDGLYRHSPLDEAAWGRGNGFPALGLALSLSEMPGDIEGREEMVKAFQSHMAALARHQDPTGAWHQVIDHPESYRELTSTCMITFAMIRGVRRGWLDAQQYTPVIERAWKAILTRVPANGRLVDVCTGTGKQKNLRAYLDRTAILGRDDRGGAMALMAATEMAAWEKGR